MPHLAAKFPTFHAFASASLGEIYTDQHLAAKFPTFHAFASASLGEIYTDQHLAAAKRFTVNSLDSGVWRNQGDGTFTFLPLPTLAQASPTFGMALAETMVNSIVLAMDGPAPYHHAKDARQVQSRPDRQNRHRRFRWHALAHHRQPPPVPHPRQPASSYEAVICNTGTIRGRFCKALTSTECSDCRRFDG